MAPRSPSPPARDSSTGHPNAPEAGAAWRPQPLLLVQARNLITGLALPALLTGPDGGLLFFNDAAADQLGRTFEEVGPLPREEWAREIGPLDAEGKPLASDHLPLATALRDGRPAQGRFWARLGSDPALREVEVSAIPLIEPDLYEGALVVFWPAEQAGSVAV